jgi:hypothetical protein
MLTSVAIVANSVNTKVSLPASPGGLPPGPFADGPQLDGEPPGPFADGPPGPFADGPQITAPQVPPEVRPCASNDTDWVVVARGALSPPVVP